MLIVRIVLAAMKQNKRAFHDASEEMRWYCNIV